MAKCSYQIVIESGLYRADKHGNVESIHTGKWKPIRPTVKPGGYTKFNAYLGHSVYTLNTHRFVWIFLKGHIPDGFEVNHIDFNKQNNQLSNLEAISKMQNVKHAKDAGKMKKPKDHQKGIKNSRAKLTESQVIEIFYQSKFVKTSALMQRYSVGRTAINDIANKRSWGHLWQNQAN